MPLNVPLVDTFAPFRQSIGQLTNALQDAPRMQMERLQLGQAQRAVGQQAEHDKQNLKIQQAVSGIPDIEERHRVAANLLESFGRFDEAQKIKDVDLQAIQALKDTNPEAYHQGIVKHYNMGNVPYAPKDDIGVLPESSGTYRKSTGVVITPPTAKQTELEKEAAPWISKNPGKDLSDYVAYKKALPGPAPAPSQYGDFSSGDPTKVKNAIDYAQRTGDPELKDLQKQHLRQSISQERALELTPEGLDMAARAFATTGELPAMGMGGAGGTRQKIMNRAAELYPNLDLASAKSGYQADKGSLTAITKNRDAVAAFENTASKNLDQFLTTAKKVVDTGSPWINKPIRSVSMSGFGSGDLAAYNAARKVALIEIAKVTNNPNLSSQLSDSARHEVESLLPESATLKQIYDVAQILKTDMRNRGASLDQQISDIKGRIRVGGSQTPLNRSEETLPDGSVWKKNPDGTRTRIK